MANLHSPKLTAEMVKAAKPENGKPMMVNGEDYRLGTKLLREALENLRNG